MCRIIFEALCEYIEGLGCVREEIEVGDNIASKIGAGREEVIRVKVPDYLLPGYFERFGEEREAERGMKVISWRINRQRLLNDWIQGGCSKEWKLGR